MQEFELKLEQQKEEIKKKAHEDKLAIENKANM